MKTARIILLIVLWAILLVACGNEKVQEAPTEPQTVPTVPETEPPTEPETEPPTEPPETEPEIVPMTYEEFLEKTTGCWFDASTIHPDSQSYHYLLVAKLQEEDAVISYWPGEKTGSSFYYDDLVWLGGNEYELYITVPPENFEGVIQPGYSTTMIFTFFEDGTLGVQNGEATYHFTYGGTTPREAAETAKSLSS